MATRPGLRPRWSSRVRTLVPVGNCFVSPFTWTWISFDMASSYCRNAGFRTQGKAEQRGDFVHFRTDDESGFGSGQLWHFKNDCGLAACFRVS
jgi:hypothetical protein